MQSVTSTAASVLLAPGRGTTWLLLGVGISTYLGFSVASTVSLFAATVEFLRILVLVASISFELDLHGVGGGHLSVAAFSCPVVRRVILLGPGTWVLLGVGVGTDLGVAST